MTIQYITNPKFMKYSKRKLTETQLLNLVEERLNLQSTKRFLESYRLPKYTLNYFKSVDFARTFQGWTESRKTEFLKSLAGEYWKSIEVIINKEVLAD